MCATQFARPGQKTSPGKQRPGEVNGFPKSGEQNNSIAHTAPLWCCELFTRFVRQLKSKRLAER